MTDAKTLVIGAAILVVAVLLLAPAAPDDAPAEATAVCSVTDLAKTGKRLLEDPGTCLDEIISGGINDEGNWHEVVFSYEQSGVRAIGPSMRSLDGNKYAAEASTDGADSTLKVEIQNGGEVVWETNLAVGSAALIQVTYLDLPGEDVVVFSRGGTELLEATY